MAKAKTTGKATSKTTRKATRTGTAEKATPKLTAKKAAKPRAAKSATVKAKSAKTKPTTTRAKSAAAKATPATAKTKSAATRAKSSKTTTARKTKSNDKVTIDRRAQSGQRRTQTDRRKKAEPIVVERRILKRRAKVNRRRQIDPTTCERDYSGEELEFMNALDNYKRTSGRMFPTCSEVLEVIRGLGYDKRPTTEKVSDEQPTTEKDSQQTTLQPTEQPAQAIPGEQHDWQPGPPLGQPMGQLSQMPEGHASDSLIYIADGEDPAKSASMPTSLGHEDCDITERVAF